MSIADHLLDRLAEAGVRHVFGVPGDYNLRLLDAVDAHPRLEWVGTANELDAAYAADGYARLNGLAAVITTYGVGELSALNAVAGSFAESVPVLMIAGAPSTDVQEAGLPVHHSLLDGDSKHFARAYQAVTCASALLSAADATDAIDRVLARMLAEKRPGYVMLPADLVDAPAAPAAALVPRPAPAGDLAGFSERAKRMLAPAERVVVLVDHLAQRHGVGEELAALIAAGNLPSAIVAPAKSALDEFAPGFLGLYIGALSEPHVREAVERADVVIGAGLRLIDLSSGGFTAELDPRRLIDLKPDFAIAGGESFDGVAMDAALHALAELVPRMPDRIAPAAATAASEDDPEGQLTQAAFWRRIAGFLREGDLIAADQGTPFYGVLGVRLPAGTDLIAQPIWSSIGYALPALMGAQLASAPGRRAILLVGDGSFQMSAQELGTSIRQGLAPVIFLLNNQGYAVERTIHGPAAGYNDIAPWDWSHVPAAFGAHPDAVVMRVHTEAELAAVLAVIDASPGALAFVEVVLDRGDVPPVLAEVGRTIARRNEGAAAIAR
jgi:indolepyruvate decarboxylase